jgi:hypothetical protein
MQIFDRIVDLIESSVPTFKSTPSGWKKANCPVCVHRGHRADRRSRFGLLVKNSSLGMNCFNCGFSAKWQTGQELGHSLQEFFRAVGVDQTLIQALKFDAYVAAHQIQGQQARAQPINKFLDTWQAQPLPSHSYSLQWWHTQGVDDPDFATVWQYAQSRCMFDLNQVYWSPQRENMINKRLIVPYHYQNQIVGWGGRLASHSTTGVKYYQQAPPHFVYGLDHQHKPRRQWTILTEGVLDAIVVDGVAVLHNRVSDQQAWLLNRLDTQIVVCPDRDPSGDQLVWDAVKHGWWVSFPRWEPNIKDANQAVQKYGRLFVVESILTHRTRDAAKIKVWRKLDLGN